MIGRTLMMLLSGVVAFSFSAVALPQSDQSTYKVVAVELWNLQERLNKEAIDGWQIRSMASHSQCVFTRPSGKQEKAECIVVVLGKGR